MSANLSAKNNTPTIGVWLVETMVQLKAAGVDAPRRDALVLLEDTLGKDRVWVTTHPEFVLQRGTLQRVNVLVERRIQREPLAYIRGRAWFYGRFFTVSPEVLIPRPESESFIEVVKQIKPTKVIDVGTGSGALAVTVALEVPKSSVIATDLSPKALETTAVNAAHHAVTVATKQGDLLAPLSDSELAGATIMANLPYVPKTMQTEPELAEEPAEALFSGADGLDHYRRFWEQISDRSVQPVHILIESLMPQHDSLTALAQAAGYHLQHTDVLVQHFERR